MSKDNISDFKLCAGLLFSQTFQTFPKGAVLNKKYL